MSLLNRFKNRVDKGMNNLQSPNINSSKFRSPEDLSNLTDEELLERDLLNLEKSQGGFSEDFGFMQSQKPESFHHFILENQYQDIERLVRGFKDVWDKDRGKWVTKRKEKHCFTDEEAEDILRVLQGYFSTDNKLGTLSIQEYPIILNMVFDQLYTLFREIMEYRYGRYGDFHEQLKMKQQAISIFNVVMIRIKMNLSRAIGGQENKFTHDSVKGQESLNQSDNMRGYGRRGYI